MARWHTTGFDFYPERAFRPRPGGGMTLEGGKRSSAPAPDPRLVDAQIRSMGYPTMGMQTTGAGAGYGSSAQMIANNGLAGLNSGLMQGSQAAGAMGSNATNMWGAQASYKNQQDQIANASNPLSTILGSGAGIGTAFTLNRLFKP